MLWLTTNEALLKTRKRKALFFDFFCLEILKRAQSVRKGVDPDEKHGAERYHGKENDVSVQLASTKISDCVVLLESKMIQIKG